ncbi:alkaline phosphatase family protein [Algoriphagus machipongonensis]|uniref:Metalloenzyme family protein n=1 Tax=Algoriphagus machipongonensis TaxID=388413 RepID=A3I2P5_9BACT|nr:alkaline phosphatase family protein [Algoriphagus machipongonensis]EAZ79349.1 putative metalloenzyme family protein [Algoriphagus machipongonensis]
MKNTFPLIAFSFLLLFFSSYTPKAKSPKHVLIFGIDGLSVEGLEKAKTPNIDKLFSDGVLSINTRSVMPSVTLPNWTSHLTSGGPEQHGVTFNGWTLEEHELNPIESDAEGYYPSIFKTLKEQTPEIKTAFYYNWGNLINSFNQKYLDEVSFEADDQYVENYEKALQFSKDNQEVPTLIFLYTVHVDHAGHSNGWMSKEYIKAIEAADKAIGDFIKNMKSEDLFKDTSFLLITDHGGKGNGHGGLSMGEMEVPWAITGPNIKKDQNFKSPNSNANTARIIADIFGVKELQPSAIGITPKGIFKK